MPTARFEATVSGQYLAQLPDGGRTKKAFEVKAKLATLKPDALSKLKNTILQRLVLAKYPDMIRIRTRDITKVEALDKADKDKIPPRWMTRKQLVAYNKKMKLGVNNELYTDLSDFRGAVQAAQEDNEAFLKHQKVREERRGPQMKDMAELEELNLEGLGSTEVDDL